MGCHLGIALCPFGRAKCCQEFGEKRAEEREHRSGFGAVSESSWARRSLGAAPSQPTGLSRLHTEPSEVWSSNTSPLLLRFTCFLNVTRKLEEKSPRTHFRLKIRTVSLPLNSDLSHILGSRGRQRATTIALRGTVNTHFSAEYL